MCWMSICLRVPSCCKIICVPTTWNACFSIHLGQWNSALIGILEDKFAGNCESSEVTFLAIGELNGFLNLDGSCPWNLSCFGNMKDSDWHLHLKWELRGKFDCYLEYLRGNYLSLQSAWSCSGWVGLSWCSSLLHSWGFLSLWSNWRN